MEKNLKRIGIKGSRISPTSSARRLTQNPSAATFVFLVDLRRRSFSFRQGLPCATLQPPVSSVAAERKTSAGSFVFLRVAGFRRSSRAVTTIPPFSSSVLLSIRGQDLHRRRLTAHLGEYQQRQFRQPPVFGFLFTPATINYFLRPFPHFRYSEFESAFDFMAGFTFKAISFAYRYVIRILNNVDLNESFPDENWKYRKILQSKNILMTFSVIQGFNQTPTLTMRLQQMRYHFIRELINDGTFNMKMKRLSASLFIATTISDLYPMDTGIHRIKPLSQVNQVCNPDFLGYGTNSYSDKDKLHFNSTNTIRLPDTSCLSDYKSLGSPLHPRQQASRCLQPSDMLKHLRFALSISP
ncbi:hypothetical protein LXL04_019775 [Taraxacum kok-saghyz]